MTTVPLSTQASCNFALLGCFNKWLLRKGLTTADVDSMIMQQYLRGRAQSGKVRSGDSTALSALLHFLRPDSSAAPSRPVAAADVALIQFQDYLRSDRSLAEATVVNDTSIVRAFVTSLFPAGRLYRSRVGRRQKFRLGKRDYALLLLLTRLGLPAGEVVALTSDEIDWGDGLINVKGKGNRMTQMPLAI